MVRWSEAEVSEQKVLGYLLAADHPVGGAKAVFFRALGYERVASFVSARFGSATATSGRAW
jgi:hypothetical protein